MTTILVTGATGRVGRHVVQGLLDAGVSVRALVRDPLRAGLPPEVEVVQGDIYDPAAVERAASEVEAAFLLWPAFSAEGAEPVVAALTKQVSRVVYLSSLNVNDEDPGSSGVWGELEALLADADWTFVRPGGFMVNTQEWADQIRAGDVVRMPSPGAARSLIHERDIAAVAVQALLDDKHIGQAHRLTGPEVLTQAEQVAILGEVLGQVDPSRGDPRSRRPANDARPRRRPQLRRRRTDLLVLPGRQPRAGNPHRRVPTQPPRPPLPHLGRRTRHRFPRALISSDINRRRRR